jgi:hypothetical protein
VYFQLYFRFLRKGLSFPQLAVIAVSADPGILVGNEAQMLYTIRRHTMKRYWLSAFSVLLATAAIAPVAAAADMTIPSLQDRRFEVLDRSGSKEAAKPSLQELRFEVLDRPGAKQADKLQQLRYDVLDRGGAKESDKLSLQELRLEHLDSRSKNAVHQLRLNNWDMRQKSDLQKLRLDHLDSRSKSDLSR